MLPIGWLWFGVICGFFALGSLFYVERIWSRNFTSINLARAWTPRPVWVRNTHNKVTAVCLHTDFVSALLKQRDLGQGTDVPVIALGEHYLREDGPLVYVNPTFTFVLEEAKLAHHTGTLSYYQEMLEELVHRVTGYWPDQMTNDALKEVLQALAPEAPRFFVPFSGSVLRNGPTTATIDAALGSLQPIDARRTLLDVKLAPAL